MFVNHEYTNENIMLPPETDQDDLIEIGMAAHGLTVVELERQDEDSPYSYVEGAELNRRILLRDELALTGPAAGSDLLKTAGDPTGTDLLGTLGNCARALTPGGPRPPEDRRGPDLRRRAGHPRQLRRRPHPVGDAALRRGELPRVLPHRRHLRGGPALRPRRRSHRPRLGGEARSFRRPERGL